MTALDPVIKVVEVGTRPAPPYQKVVNLDPRNGKFVEDSLWQVFTPRQAFLVSTDAEAVAFRQNLKVVSNGLEIWLDYQVRCVPNCEIKIAEALWGAASPQAKLEYLLQGWILDFLRNHEGEFLNAPDTLAELLKQDLAARAEKEVGLSLKASLHSAEQLWMRPRTLESFHFPARARDIDFQFDLCLDAEFRVDPAQMALACSKRSQVERVFETIPEALTELAARQFDLHQFYADLGSVQSALQEHLKSLLLGHGWRVERLQLSGGPDVPGLVEETKLTWQESFLLRDLSEPLQIEAEALLKLRDLGAFARAGCPDLKNWLREEIQRLAPGALFDLSHLQIRQREDQIVKKLIAALRAEVSEIGYEARLAIRFLDLLPLPPSRRIQHQVHYLFSGAAQPVFVSGDFLLECRDVDRFVAARITDIETWLRQRLPVIAAEVLFGMTLRRLSVLAWEKQKEIEKRLSEQAQEIGYALEANITFRGLHSRLLEPVQIEHSCSFPLEGYDKQVKANSKLIIQVGGRKEELQRYLDSGCPDLGEWAQEIIQDLARECLFGKSYPDLCIDLEDHKATIKNRLQEEARKIGCEVKLLITLTDLLPEQLATGQEIRFERRFPSKLQDVSVGLGFEAKIRIADLHPLRELLGRHPDLVDYMEKTVRDRLEQTLREMDPSEFYTEFQEPLPEDGQPVNRRLEKIARQALQKGFGAEILDIHCWQLETDLSQAFLKLRRFHFITVRVERLRGELDLEFRATLRVSAVAQNGWHTFHQFVPTPETLIQRATEHLSAMLIDRSWEDLIQTSNEELQAEIYLSLQQRLAHDFGIEVELTGWQRLATGLERSVAKKRQDFWMRDLEESEQLAQLIAKLKLQLYNQIAADLDADRVDKLQARIDVLEQKRIQLLQRSGQPLHRLKGKADQSTRALNEGSTDDPTEQMR